MAKPKNEKERVYLRPDPFEQVLDYEFWLWEYQRRNFDYRIAYDDIMKYAIESIEVNYWAIENYGYNNLDPYPIPDDVVLPDCLMLPRLYNFAKKNIDFLLRGISWEIDLAHSDLFHGHENFENRTQVVSVKQLREIIDQRIKQMPDCLARRNLELFQYPGVSFYEKDMVDGFLFLFMRYPKPYKYEEKGHDLLKSLIKNRISFRINGMSLMTFPSYYVSKRAVESLKTILKNLYRIFPDIPKLRNEMLFMIANMIPMLRGRDPDTIKNFEMNFNTLLSSLVLYLAKHEKIIRLGLLSAKKPKIDTSIAPRILGLMLYDHMQHNSGMNVQDICNEVCDIINNEITRSEEDGEGQSYTNILNKISDLSGDDNRLEYLLLHSRKCVEDMTVYDIEAFRKPKKINNEVQEIVATLSDQIKNRYEKSITLEPLDPYENN